MNNKSSVLSTILGILGFIAGVSYCFTLILIPVAIYCFIGAKKYIDAASYTDSQMAMQKKSFTNWAIFYSIALFPIGLLSIIVAWQASTNNVVITDAQYTTNTSSETGEQVNNQREPEVAPASKEETIEKLSKLKEEGLISEEEYERAKAEVIEDK